VLPPMIRSVFSNPNLDEVVIVSIATFGVIFPLSIPRFINNLRFSSGLAIVAHLYVVGLTTVYGISNLVTTKNLPNILTTYGDWVKIIQAIPIIVFAYTCSVQAVPIFNELEDRTPRGMRKVILNGVGLSFVCYTLLGMFGFIKYGEGTNQNIFDNFSAEAPETVARLLFSISICLGLPLSIWPCRNTILELLFSHLRKCFIASQDSQSMPMILIVFTTFLVISFAFLISIVVPNISIVFSFFGSTSASLSSFIIPAILFLKVTATDNLRDYHFKERCFSIFLLFFGVISGVLGVIASLILQIRCKTLMNNNCIEQL